MPGNTAYTGLLNHPILTMPQPAGDNARNLIFGAALILAIWAIIRLRRDRGVFLLVLAAALASSMMEGWAEFIAMNYHPEIGGHVAYRAWTMPVPVHIVFSYVLYFGGPAYGLIHLVRHTTTAGKWWIYYGLLCLGVALADLAALYTNVWMYYGHQPFVVHQFPLTWMFCNTASMFGFTAIIHLCASHLRGLRRLLTLFIAPVGLSMLWAAVSLPIGNALHSDSGPTITMFAAIASIVVSLCITYLTIRYFCHAGRNLSNPAATLYGRMDRAGG